jgi:high frequency lysogenization protein
MSPSLRDKSLALAGIFQAAHLVQEIARRGVMDAATFEVSIKSLFKIDAATTDEVYGNIPGDLELGLHVLRDHLQGGRKQAKDLEVVRYVLNLIVLEKRLFSDPKTLEKLGIGIERARRQAEHLSATHNDVITNLADLYANTISTLGSRIVINGEISYLKDPEKVTCIRALLLAGIRSAVLWRQKGGRRWEIVLSRNKYMKVINKILSEDGKSKE